jgi:hypothetical protein
VYRNVKYVEDLVLLAKEKALLQGMTESLKKKLEEVTARK